MNENLRRKVPLILSSGALFILILGVLWLAREAYVFYGKGIQAALPSLVGLSPDKVVEKLGKPQGRYSGTQYLKSKRERIADSFYPPPPQPTCDEVFEYTNGNYVALVFFQAGRVVECYWGQT